MKLFLFHARRRLWLLAILGGVLLILVFLQPHHSFAFYHESSELYPSLITALLCAFILTSDTENEFARCYGVSFVRLGLAHWMPHFLYPLGALVLSCPVYWALYRAGLHAGELPWEAVSFGVLLFSQLVTILLVSSCALVLRVLVRNMYATLSAFLTVFTPFYTLHGNLVLKKVPMSLAKYDIWITGLLYSEKYDVSMETWLGNRLAFLGVALLLMMTALILLKQKNYQNIR